IVRERGVVAVARGARLLARVVVGAVEALERGARGHRAQVPEPACRAFDHAMTGALDARPKTGVAAQRAALFALLARASGKAIRAGAEPPPDAHEIARHLEAVAHEVDARVVVVREADGKALDDEPVRERRREHLEVEAEAIDGADGEERARRIGAERLQAALRVAEREADREPGEEREELPGDQANEAVAAVQ